MGIRYWPAVTPMLNAARKIPLRAAVRLGSMAPATWLRTGATQPSDSPNPLHSMIIGNITILGLSQNVYCKIYETIVAYSFMVSLAGSDSINVVYIFMMLTAGKSIFTAIIPAERRQYAITTHLQWPILNAILELENSAAIWATVPTVNTTPTTN